MLAELLAALEDAADEVAALLCAEERLADEVLLAALLRDDAAELLREEAAELLLRDEAAALLREAALEEIELADADERADDDFDEEELDVLAVLFAQNPGELMLPLAGIVWFQDMAVRVTVPLLWTQFAFQSWLTCASGNARLPLQLLTCDAPVLRTVISPQNPVPQSLVMR